MAVRPRMTTSLSVKHRIDLLKISKRQCEFLFGFSMSYLLRIPGACSIVDYYNGRLMFRGVTEDSTLQQLHDLSLNDIHIILPVIEEEMQLCSFKWNPTWLKTCTKGKIIDNGTTLKSNDNYKPVLANVSFTSGRHSWAVKGRDRERATETERERQTDRQRERERTAKELWNFAAFR